MTAIVAEKSEFQILDDADSKQIETADSALKQALIYKNPRNGSQQLTYTGIKWLVLHMAQKGQPLSIYDKPDVELVKHDPEDKSQWIWYATVKARNVKTGLDSIGASEQPFLDEHRGNQYDPFGRTKAISKAERNAFRKQIPELEIVEVIKQAQSDQIEVIDSTPKTETKTPTPATETSPETSDAPTEKQISYLKFLCYTGKKPKTKTEASDIIKSIKEGSS